MGQPGFIYPPALLLLLHSSKLQSEFLERESVLPSSVHAVGEHVITEDSLTAEVSASRNRFKRAGFRGCGV